MLVRIVTASSLGRAAPVGCAALLAQVLHERSLHRWCDEEKQRNPAECSPNHEESVSHSVVFVLQLPEKCSKKGPLCQLFSAMNFPRISLILLSLACTR